LLKASRHFLKKGRRDLLEDDVRRELSRSRAAVTGRLFCWKM
jgi:hypothetical protein